MGSLRGLQTVNPMHGHVTTNGDTHELLQPELVQNRL